MTDHKNVAQGGRGLLSRACVLLAVAFAALALLAPYLFWQGGVALFSSAASAAAVCSLSCLAGLALTHFMGRSASETGSHSRFLAGLLGGMFLRLALPLSAALWVKFSPAALGDDASKTAFLMLLILFYLILLAAETLLLLPQLKPRVPGRPTLAPLTSTSGVQRGN